MKRRFSAIPQHHHSMTQDELKRLVGKAAADYVIQNVPEGAVIGVGTGSTANCFIDALAVVKAPIAAPCQLRRHDRAPEVSRHQGVRPERGRLAAGVRRRRRRDRRERRDDQGRRRRADARKIVASVADTFVCIADASKRDAGAGCVPLPIEVVPMRATSAGA